MNKKITLVAVLLAMLWSCKQQEKPKEDLQQKYANVLDIEGIPQKQFKLEPFGFSDMGAWHGYALPHKDSTSYYGGFSGPLSMKMWGQWISKSLCRLYIMQSGKNIDLSKAKAKMIYYPGKLKQQLSLNNWQIDISLIFVSNRTALLQSNIKNKSKEAKKITIGWKGALFNKGLNIRRIQNGFCIDFEKGEQAMITLSNKELSVEIDTTAKSYTMTIAQDINMKAKSTVSFELLQSYYFNNEEEAAEKDSLSVWFKNPQVLFARNNQRWNNYLQKVFSYKTKLLEKQEHKQLAVKCVQTLLSNWRSPAGDLQHSGVFPSAAYQGFYGFWSWDSWKQAVALVRFFPELAKSNVQSMFQYQDSLGMVADCVYFDPKENNWRDTKAPLATWSVLKIFEQTGDTAFVKIMYPKLVKYHEWWYKYRDHDQNKLCEYGSTDGSLIAAKWESGMDNAVRFDSTKLLKNNQLAWSMNQESVDLNAYLCAEKQQLSILAKILGKTNEAELYEKEYNSLKLRIQTEFWDSNTGFFYDRELKTGKLLTVQQGTEGWTALYTNIATKEQAKSVRKVMIDYRKFNTKMPLPTLSAMNPKFNPMDGYWRGPVWIDQAYFGIKALENYSYRDIADSLSLNLLQNAEGLLGKSAIHENYHPITGKALNAKHFSWSAAHYLMLLTD